MLEVTNAVKDLPPEALNIAAAYLVIFFMGFNSNV